MEFYTIPKGMENELYHYGVKGMKWGRRTAREHAGPGKYLTRKRQLAGDKRDLAALNKGQHLSVGLTKKRQAAFDARDKRALEKRIAKNETKANMTQEQKSERRKKAIKVGAAVAGTVLAAYGAYKVNQFVKNKNVDIARQIGRRKDGQMSKAWDSTERMKNLKAMGDGVKSTNYRNSGKTTMGFFEESYANKAKQDNFVQAAKNVYRDYDVRRRRAKGKKIYNF